MRDDYYGLLRPEILEMIPAGCRSVLDVGCGSGALGAHLKQTGVQEVCGIEIFHDAATQARTVLDEVVEGNIEQVELPFRPGQFDCIICADVLEHLVDPWAMVGKLKALLAPGGCIVASLPNVGFHRIVRGLMKGQWRYGNAGILDRTHLRFFTLPGVEELFTGNGMSVEAISRKIDGGWNIKLLNVMMFNRIKESLVFQYVVRARQS
ncbi:SAM-dependent methyltransferase [Geomonas sp. Red276]